MHHEADDCWCDGVNLRTDRRGIFPSAYVIDVDYDFDPDGRRLNKERYALDYLGSVETMLHKGEEVLCAAVQRIRRLSNKPHSQSCMLEISDHGIHVTDKCSEKTSDVSSHHFRNTTKSDVNFIFKSLIEYRVTTTFLR